MRFFFACSILVITACGAKFNPPSSVKGAVTLPLGNNTVQLNWSAPSTGAPDSYFVEASPNGTDFLSVGTVSGTSTSLNIPNLGSGKLWFRVSAINTVAQTVSTQLTFTVP